MVEGFAFGIMLRSANADSVQIRTTTKQRTGKNLSAVLVQLQGLEPWAH